MRSVVDTGRVGAVGGAAVEAIAAPRRDARERLALALVCALYEAGAPAHRLEDAMARFAEAVGLRHASFLVVSSAILVSFANQGPVLLLRPAQSATRLDRLLSVDEVAGRVARQELDVEDGLTAVRAAVSAPPSYGEGAVSAAGSMSAAGAATMFGGGAPEALVAASVALWVSALSMLAEQTDRSRGLVLIVPMLAALVVTLAVSTVASVIPVAVEPATLGALVMLLPGFTLTTALTELATGHLLSGVARLLAALTTLVQLALGVALGAQLAGAVGLAPLGVVVLVAPAGVAAVAVLVLALSLGVLLQAPLRDLPIVVAACLAAIIGARLGAHSLGPAIGGGLGALTLTLLANGFARSRDRPAALLLVPGMFVLVPGSLALRATSALVGLDVAGGGAIAVSALLAASGLAAGSLLGNAIIAPRRAL